MFSSICAKYQIDHLKTWGGVDYTNLYPIMKPNLKILYDENAIISTKTIFKLQQDLSP